MATTTSNQFSRLTFNSYGNFRRETLAGEEYVVVPVVLMVEGVFKGNNGDFKYTENHLSKFPEGWNNKPVLLRHPDVGKGGAGSTAVLEKQGLGILLNTKYENSKLKSEAWLKSSRLSLEPRLLTAIEAGNPVSVSTGLFHDYIVTENSSEPREVCNIVPDHLAILFDEEPAVSIEAGAGLLMNSKGPTQNELVAGDVREQLYAVLNKRFVGDGSLRTSLSIYVEDFFPDSQIVIYEFNGVLYKLGYSAKGDVITLDEGAPERVVRQRQYRIETGALVGSTNNSKGTTDMTKATLIAAIMGVAGNRLTQEQLEGMDEAVLTNLAPVAGTTTTETPPATQNAAGTQPAPFDFNAWMNAAPPNVRAFVDEGVQTLQTQRQTLISELTTNAKFTAEELAPLSTPVLRKMAAAAKPAAPAAPAADPMGMGGMHFRFAGASGVAPTQNAAGGNEAPTPLLAPDYSAQ